MRKKGKGSKDPKKGQWNMVPIGEEFLQEKDMENLISLEVLTDYHILKKSDGITQIFLKSDTTSSVPIKGTKRKAMELVEEENESDGSKPESDDDDEENESDGSKPESADDDEEPEVISIDDDIDDNDKVKSQKQISTPKKKLKLAEQIKVNQNKNKPIQKKPVKVEAAKTETNNSVKIAATSNKWAVVESLDMNSTEDENKADFQKKIKKIKEAKKKLKLKKDLKEIGKPFGRNTSFSEPTGETVSNLDFSSEEWMKIGVRDPVLKALKEAKFDKPTPIQSLTLPAALLGKKDVVGAAETGSGKTLAFAIPIIHGILQARSKAKEENPDYDEEDEPLQSLILTPTRELAVQIKKHFDVAAKYARIKTVVIVGGLAAQKQERLLRWKPQVVIATPGRLWELAKEGDPHLATLNQIKFLAVDETDRMVERGHFQELEGILGVINKNPEVKFSRQNFVFSATLAFTHEPPQRRNKNIKHKPKKITSKEKLNQIMEMIGVRQNPKIVDICTGKGTCETLIENQITCALAHKEYYIYYFLIQHPGRTIIFCNSINTVRRLTNLFFLLNLDVLPLHSEMHQKQRLKNLERFTENDKGILIATDVAARGLDIVNIQHVIHYQVPKTAESYIHRSGRTARAFKGGLALVVVEPGEMGTLRSIFRSLNRDPDVMLPSFNVEGEVFKKLRTRVEEAEKVEKFEHMVRRKLADMSWMDKAKKDMDLASDDDEYDSDNGEQQNRKNLLEAKKKLDKYKQTLNSLLADNSFLLGSGIKV